MEINFTSRKIAKLCNSSKNMQAELGERNAKVLQQRLKTLETAETLEDMRKLPGRCHELIGDRKGQLALDLVHPLRLLFAPDHDPAPEKPDGGLDWQQVTKVLIVEIGDYH